MRRELPGGYELDDDPARLDLEAIWDFLSTEAYWGTDRSRDVVERQVREAARTIGLYHEGRQVGFARVVSDGRIAYLADVYVLGEHRGHGWASSSSAPASTRVPSATCGGCSTPGTRTACTSGSGSGRPSDRVLERPPAGERR